MKYGSIKGYRNNQTQFAYQSKKLVGVITHYLVPFCKDTQLLCGKSSTSWKMYNLQLQNCVSATFEVKEPGGYCKITLNYNYNYYNIVYKFENSFTCVLQSKIRKQSCQSKTSYFTRNK